MKHVKLFEEYLREGGLDDLNLTPPKPKEKEEPADDKEGGDKEGEDKEKKEDPIEAEKKKQEKQEKKAEVKHEEKLEDVEGDIEKLLQHSPEVKERIWDTIKKAIDASDRLLVHNAINDIIYLQQKYQEDGNGAAIELLSKVKDKLSKLDKSFTANKRI